MLLVIQLILSKRSRFIPTVFSPELDVRENDTEQPSNFGSTGIMFVRDYIREVVGLLISILERYLLICQFV